MSDKDSAMKLYISDPKVFADAMNYAMYHGERRVDPARLVELDPTEILYDEEEKKGKKGKKKERDVLKQHICCKYDGEKIYCIMGIENQTYIDYHGPFRVLRYDFSRLNKQVTEIEAKHDQEKDLTGDEMMSKFSKKDRIIPVITLMIYFGGKKWDGPRYLHELYQGEFDEQTRSRMLDYKLNLIEPAAMSKEDFEKFATDLRFVLEFSKHTANKTALRAFIEKGINSNISAAAARVINSIVNIKKEIAEGEESVNMNSIMEEIKQDWINEARVEWINETRVEATAEGIAKGRIEGAVNTARSLGVSGSQLIDTVVKTCNTTPEAVKAYLAKVK